MALACRSEEAKTYMDELRDDACQLAKLEAGPGQQAVEAFQATFPQLPSEHLVAAPSEVGTAFFIDPAADSVTDMVANNVAKYASEFGVNANPRKVDEAWVETNEVLLEEYCEKLEEDKPVPNKCHKAGMCLCSPDGRLLLRFATRFHDLCFKPEAPPHSTGRVHAKEGRWAFLFQGVENRANLVDAANAVLPAPTEVILHVALHYLAPWRPTWQLLVRTTAPLGNPPETESRMYTQAIYSMF